MTKVKGKNGNVKDVLSPPRQHSPVSIAYGIKNSFLHDPTVDQFEAIRATLPRHLYKYNKCLRLYSVSELIQEETQKVCRIMAYRNKRREI